MRRRQSGEYQGHALAFTGWMLLHKRAERLPSPDLKQQRVFLLQQVCDALGKAHGLAHVLRPVGWAGGLLVRDPCSGYARNVRNVWLVQHHTFRQICNCFTQWVKHGGMESVCRLDAATRDPLPVEFRLKLLNRLVWTGQDTCCRRIEGSQADLVSEIRLY